MSLLRFRSEKKTTSFETWDLDSFREPLGRLVIFPSFRAPICEMSFVSQLN